MNVKYESPVNSISSTGINLDFDEKFIPDSRQDFFENIEKKIQNPPNNTHSTIILGDWGEGKSYTLKKLIPRNIEANQTYFFIETNTIKNIFYKNRENLFKLELETEKFLYLIFKSCQAHLNENEIFNQYSSNSPKDFVYNILREFAQKWNNIFFLIDEFENIILERENADLIKMFMTGMKATLEEDEIKIIKDSEGLLQFFINCTPAAYHQIEREPDLEQIMGGINRRLDRKKLNPLQKSEAFDFLQKLQKFVWNNKHPGNSFLRYNNAFSELITKVGLFNFGFMQTYVSDLINDYSKTLDHSDILKYLLDKQALHSTEDNLVNNEIYETILELKPDEIPISAIDFLIAHQFPLIESKFLKKFNFNAMNLYSLNQKINSRYNFPMAISLKKIKGKDDLGLLLFQKFKESGIVEKDQDGQISYNFNDFVITKNCFDEKFYYCEFDEISGDIIKKWFIVDDSENFNEIFSFKDKNLGKTIFNVYIKDIRNELEILDENYLILNPKFSNILFPQPIPPELDFILEKEIRDKTWREIEQNLEENFKLYFNEGLKSIFNQEFVDSYELLKFDNSKFQSNLIKIKAKLLDNYKNAINIAIIPQYSKITLNEIKKLNAFLLSENKSKDPIFIVMIFHLEPIGDKIRSSLDFRKLVFGENNDFPNTGIFLNLRPKIVKNIVAIGKAIKNELKIVERKKKNLIYDIFREIKVKDKIKNMGENLPKRGVIVPNIKVDDGIDFPSLNKLNHQIIRVIHDDSTDIYEFFDSLKRLKKYGSKGKGIIYKDIESEDQFNKYKDVLIKNGFFNPVYQTFGQETFQIHPVEEKIIKILNYFKEGLKKDELKSFFIDSSDNPNNFNFFLNSVEFKGYVSKNGKNFIKNDLTMKSKEICNRVSIFLNEGKFDDFSIYHYCNSKNRDSNIITHKLYSVILEKYFENYKTTNQEVLKNSYVIMMEEILNYYNQNISAHFETSKNFLKSQSGGLNSFKTDISNLKSKMQNLYKKIKDITPEIVDIESLTEFSELNKVLKNFNQYELKFNEVANEESLKLIYEENDETYDKWFHYNNLKQLNQKNPNKSGNLFVNIIQRDLKSEFDIIAKNFDEIFKNYQKTSTRFVSPKEKLRSILLEVRDDEEAPISQMFKDEKLNNLEKEPPKLKINLYRVKGFNDIVEKLMAERANYSENETQITKFKEKLKKTQKQEKNIKKAIEESNNIIEIISKSIIPENIVNINEFFKDLNDKLENGKKIVKKENIDDQIKYLESIYNDIDNNKTMINIEKILSQFCDDYLEKCKIIERQITSSGDLNELITQIETCHSEFKKNKMNLDKLERLVLKIQNIIKKYEKIEETVDIDPIVFEIKELLNNWREENGSKNSNINSQQIINILKEYRDKNNLNQSIEEILNLLEKYGIIQRNYKIIF